MEKQNSLKAKFIKTNIGKIACYLDEVENTLPILFLHGVYYDHNLWNYQTTRIKDRTVITVDMPLHGKSKGLNKNNWTIVDCSKMLIEIIDALGYKKIYAIGHSWGSMTILRAASQYPEKFVAVGFCNMPLDSGSNGKHLKFSFQHALLSFREFYTNQVAKAMFSKENRKNDPEIVDYLKSTMGKLTNEEIRYLDKTVISEVQDGTPYIENLKVKALALRKNKDYVGKPANMELTEVKGAHTSPLEQPEAVLEFIRKATGIEKTNLQSSRRPARNRPGEPR